MRQGARDPPLRDLSPRPAKVGSTWVLLLCPPPSSLVACPPTHALRKGVILSIMFLLARSIWIHGLSGWAGTPRTHPLDSLSLSQHYLPLLSHRHGRHGRHGCAMSGAARSGPVYPVRQCRAGSVPGQQGVGWRGAGRPAWPGRERSVALHLAHPVTLLVLSCLIVSKPGAVSL